MDYQEHGAEWKAEQAALLLAAEYEALRSEIGRYQDHQKDLMNLALVGLGILFAFAGVLLELRSQGDDVEDPGAVLFLFPLLYVLLAWTSFDRSRRIIDIAGYLDNHVRTVARLLTGVQVFDWERHKWDRYHSRDASTMHIVAALLPSLLAYVVPSLIAVITYVLIFSWPPARHWWLVMMDVLVFLTYAPYLRYLASEASGLQQTRTEGGDPSE